MENLPPSVLAALLGLAVTFAWFLLRQKDEKQAEQITLLFQKHDKDAQDLVELKLQIARDHYVKSELDQKFDKLERTFTDGFKEIGGKMDRLTSVLTEHISGEDRPK